MSQTALVLAAHGSDTDPEVNQSIRRIADEMAHVGNFADVAVAFHRGQPSFSTVFDQLHAEEMIVVPLMAAEGYYADTVLPRELKKNPKCSKKKVHITPPVGSHPGMVDLVSSRARRLLPSIDGAPDKVTLVVIGHGTPRHEKSRSSTEELVEKLRRRGEWAEVLAAFLDEEPRVDTVVDRSASSLIVVEPFLISAGNHAIRDIPTRLGMPEVENTELPRTDRVGDKAVACDRPVGSDPGVIEMILDFASKPGKSDQNRPRSRSTALRLGTRASELALWQAEHVRDRLSNHGVRCEIVPFQTSGDRTLDRAISDLPSGSPFTDDIDNALLAGDIDLAVHSLKDLPLDLPQGLVVAAVLPRGSVTESLISRGGHKLVDLPSGATVGTSSPRRQAQILAQRPDLQPVPLRGPVDARIRQVEAGELDAAVLATAGLERLGRLDAEAERFTVKQFMPAPGQGALAIVTRKCTKTIRRLVAPLNDRATNLATRAELELFRVLDSFTLAAHATYKRRTITLCGRIFSADVFNTRVCGRDPTKLATSSLFQLIGMIGVGVDRLIAEGRVFIE
ncbi:MAG: hydroxymethylbilane synthase [Planctomycetota bacterium]